MANFDYPPTNYTLSKRKSNFLKKTITTLCFYISLFLLVGSHLLNAGIEVENRQTLFQGMTALGIVFSVVSTFLLDVESRKLLLGKVSIFYGSALLIYTLIGWILWNNDTKFIAIDLSAFLAVYAGFALFRLLLKSYYPKIQLVLLIFLGSLVIYLNLYLEAVRLKLLSTVGQEMRVAGFKGAGQYNAFLDVVNSFAIVVLCRAGWAWNIIVWGLVIFRAYSMLFLNARRSATISIIVLVLLSVLVLSYRLSNGILSNNSSIFNIQRLRLIFVCFGILLIFLGFGEFNLGKLFGHTLIEKRLFNPSASAKLSTELRFVEVNYGIESMQDIDWIFGRGMGASFVKPALITGYNNSLGNTFHIGIFSFLIKGGLILFLPCLYIIFFRIPLLFYTALIKPNAFNPQRRTALLSILPGLISWSVSLLTVGHLLPILCLPIGFAFAVYSHVEKNGLRLGDTSQCNDTKN
jgi:hypothetical protein